jgi:hypothetical protein
MRPTIEDIVQATAEEYGVETEYVCRDTKEKEVVKLRHIAQYLSKKLTYNTFASIGKKIGDRKSSNTQQAYHKIEFENGRYNDTTYLINRVLSRLEQKGIDTRDASVKPNFTTAGYLGQPKYDEHCPKCGGFISANHECKRCKKWENQQAQCVVTHMNAT